MILYHPVDDVYHCFCRLLFIIYKLPVEEHDLKKIQILDFYYLFPGLLKKIKLPRDLNIYRNYINNIKNPYSKINDFKIISIKLEKQIKDVVHHLAAYDLIDVNKLKRNLIQKTNDDKYISIIEQLSGYDNELLDFLVDVLARIPLNGEDGLKARTGLFEHRYDYVES